MSYHPPGFVQATDPAAYGVLVGAGRAWVDTSSGTGKWVLKVRNATDTAWEIPTSTGSTWPKMVFVAPGESIPDAITAVGAGGTVVLLPGTHTLGASLTVTTDLTILGCGRLATTLTGYSVIADATGGAVSVLLQGLTLGNTPCAVGDASGVATLVLRDVNVTISGSGAIGLQVGGYSNVLVDGTAISATSTVGASYGIKVTDYTSSSGTATLCVRNSNVYAEATQADLSANAFGLYTNGITFTATVERSEMIAVDPVYTTGGATYSYGVRTHAAGLTLKGCRCSGLTQGLYDSGGTWTVIEDAQMLGASLYSNTPTSEGRRFLPLLHADVTEIVVGTASLPPILIHFDDSNGALEYKLTRLACANGIPYGDPVQDSSYTVVADWVTDACEEL